MLDGDDGKRRVADDVEAFIDQTSLQVLRDLGVMLDLLRERVFTEGREHHEDFEADEAPRPLERARVGVGIEALPFRYVWRADAERRSHTFAVRREEHARAH